MLRLSLLFALTRRARIHTLSFVTVPFQHIIGERRWIFDEATTAARLKILDEASGAASGAGRDAGAAAASVEVPSGAVAELTFAAVWAQHARASTVCAARAHVASRNGATRGASLPPGRARARQVSAGAARRARVRKAPRR